jgi:UDP-2,3-diacylglucosamine pyrophosphatase LpxH
VIIDVAEERMVVVSDLHLGNPASMAAESFPAFLEYARVEGFAVCLNGDVFEMLQTGYSRVVKEALPLMTQLSRVRRRGHPVYYVVGNHDIFVEHFLDDWMVKAVCPFVNLTSGGKRIRIEHGHLYDPVFSRWPDGYEFLTRLGRPFLFAYPDVYVLWDNASHRIDRWARRRADAVEEGSAYHRAAVEVLRRGFDVVIYGHTHKPEVVELRGGLYVNAGNWVRGGTYVEIDAGRVELKRWGGK